MKICPNCGSQLNDEAKFCTECGQSFGVAAAASSFEAPVQQAPVQQAPVQQAPVQQAPVQQAPVQQAPVQQAPVQQVPVQNYSQPVSGGMPNNTVNYAPAMQAQTNTKKLNTKTIAIIAVAAVLVIAIVVGLIIALGGSSKDDKDSDSTKKSKDNKTEQVSENKSDDEDENPTERPTERPTEKPTEAPEIPSGTGYNRILEQAAEAFIDSDYTTLGNMSSPLMISLVRSFIDEEQLGTTVTDDFIKQSLGMQYSELIDEKISALKATVGEIESIDYKIGEIQTADSDDMEELKTAFDGADVSSITDLVISRVELTAEGTDGSEIEYIYVAASKEGGQWYLFVISEDDDIDQMF